MDQHHSDGWYREQQGIPDLDLDSPPTQDYEQEFRQPGSRLRRWGAIATTSIVLLAGVGFAGSKVIGGRGEGEVAGVNTTEPGNPTDVTPDSPEDRIELPHVEISYIKPRRDLRLAVVGTNMDAAFHDIFVKSPGLGPVSVDLPSQDIVSTARGEGQTSWFVDDETTEARRTIHPPCVMPPAKNAKPGTTSIPGVKVSGTTPGTLPFSQEYIGQWNEAHGGDKNCGQSPELEVKLGELRAEGNLRKFEVGPKPDLSAIQGLLTDSNYDNNKAVNKMNELMVAMLDKQTCSDQVLTLVEQQADQQWQWIARQVGSIPPERVHVTKRPRQQDKRAIQPLGKADAAILQKEYGVDFNINPNDAGRSGWVSIDNLACGKGNPDIEKLPADDLVNITT